MFHSSITSSSHRGAWSYPAEVENKTKDGEKSGLPENMKERVGNFNSNLVDQSFMMASAQIKEVSMGRTALRFLKSLQENAGIVI